MKIVRAAARLLTYAAVGYGSCVAYTFLKYGKQKRSRPASSLDRFMPEPEVIEQQNVHVSAPSYLVYESARNYDVMHSPIAHLLFDTRSWAMAAKPVEVELARIFVDQMTQVEGAIAGQQTLQLGVRQHIRVEWSLDGGDAKDSAQ